MKTDDIAILAVAGAGVLLLTQQQQPQLPPDRVEAGGTLQGGGYTNWLDALGGQAGSTPQVIQIYGSSTAAQPDYDMGSWKDSGPTAKVSTESNAFFQALVDAGASKKAATTAMERAYSTNLWQPSAIGTPRIGEGGSIIIPVGIASGKTGYEIISPQGVGMSSLYPYMPESLYSPGQPLRKKEVTASKLFGSTDKLFVIPPVPSSASNTRSTVMT